MKNRQLVEMLVIILWCRAEEPVMCPMHNVNLPWLLCLKTQLTVCLAHSRPYSRPCSRGYCHTDIALVQAQDDFTEGLQTQLVKLQQEKDASDRALQRKNSDFQRVQNVATAAVTSLSETSTKRVELQQELRSLKDSLAEVNTTKVNALQVRTAA